jgi:hypothetical protein
MTNDRWQLGWVSQAKRRDIKGNAWSGCNVEQRLEDEDEYEGISASPTSFLIRKRVASQGTTGAWKNDTRHCSGNW